MISLGLNLWSTTILARGGSVVTFSPASLFASGEEGAWYEPSTTTAFSDLGGFNFATYGQGVAHLVDKSKGATIEARRNLLTDTENFVPATSNWEVLNVTSTNPTVLANQDGDADRVTFGTIDATGDLSILRYPVESLTTAGPTYTISVELKANDAAQIGKTVFFYQNDATGILTYTAHTLTSDYVRVSVTGTWASTTRFISLATDGGSRFGNEGALTDTNAIALVRSIQLEAGSTATAYQKITTGQTISWLPGNHATQVTAGARPILARVPEGGRRNLFTQTEDFTSGDWSFSNNVSLSGSRLSATIDASAAYFGQPAKTVAGANINTWEVKYVNNPWIAINFGGGVSTIAFFNIQTGAKGTEAAGYTGTITPLADGWYRISATGSPTAGSGAAIFICDGDNDITCTAGRSVDARFPQLEPGSTATAYQKVVDEYDITEAGVTSLEYLSFDGSDDFMQFSQPTTGVFNHSVIYAGQNRVSGGSGESIIALGADNANQLRSFTDEVAIRTFGGNEVYNQDNVGTNAVVSHILNGTQSTDNAAWKNGVSLSVLSSAANTLSTAAGGVIAAKLSSPVAGFSELDLYGLVVVIRAISSAERAITEAYLAARSGVTL